MKIKTVFVFLLLFTFVHSAEQIEHVMIDPWKLLQKEKAPGELVSLTLQRKKVLYSFILNHLTLYKEELSNMEITAWRLENCECSVRYLRMSLWGQDKVGTLVFENLNKYLSALKLEDTLRFTASLPLGSVEKVQNSLKSSRTD